MNVLPQELVKILDLFSSEYCNAFSASVNLFGTSSLLSK